MAEVALDLFRQALGELHPRPAFTSRRRDAVFLA
jgi:hypothetical protein